MNETSRMSSSRAFHGSRPRTFNCPSYGMNPRIALSAVVLPAPLGPMTPRMRPSSTRKSMPSSATVVPKTLRKPRASIVAITSTLLPGILASVALNARVVAAAANQGAAACSRRYFGVSKRQSGSIRPSGRRLRGHARRQGQKYQCKRNHCFSVPFSLMPRPHPLILSV